MAESARFDEYGLTTTAEVERLTGWRPNKHAAVVLGRGWIFWRTEGDRWWPSESPATMPADVEERAQTEAGRTTQTE